MIAKPLKARSSRSQPINHRELASDAQIDCEPRKVERCLRNVYRCRNGCTCCEALSCGVIGNRGVTLCHRKFCLQLQKMRGSVPGCMLLKPQLNLRQSALRRLQVVATKCCTSS